MDTDKQTIEITNSTFVSQTASNITLHQVPSRCEDVTYTQTFESGKITRRDGTSTDISLESDLVNYGVSFDSFSGTIEVFSEESALAEADLELTFKSGIDEALDWYDYSLVKVHYDSCVVSQDEITEYASQLAELPIAISGQKGEGSQEIDITA